MLNWPGPDLSGVLSHLETSPLRELRVHREAAPTRAQQAALTLGSLAQGGLLAQQPMPAACDVHRRRMISIRVHGVGVPVREAQAPPGRGPVIAGVLTG